MGACLSAGLTVRGGSWELHARLFCSPPPGSSEHVHCISDVRMRDSRSGTDARVIDASCVYRCLLSASRHGVCERADLGARGRELWPNSGTVRVVGLNICIVLMTGTRGTGKTGRAGRGDTTGGRCSGGLCCVSGQGSSRDGSGVDVNVVLRCFDVNNTHRTSPKPL